MNEVKLSIIIVSYNTCNMTVECIRSVFAETNNINFEVIVLDNDSSDGSAKTISSEFGEKIHLIESDINLGFAAGNNLAAKEAKGNMLLLLNPDTVVLNGAIDKLIEFSQEKPEAKIWGGKTLFGDGSLNPASCWTQQTLWSLFCQSVGLSSLFRKSSLFNKEGLGGWNRDGIRSVDIVSGCYLLIRHDLWKNLNGFNHLFFMYGEEADLCLRAKKIGARPIVTSDSTIIHYGGASETIRSDKLVRLLTAKMLLIREHFPTKTQRLGYWLLSQWPLSRAWAHLLLEKVSLSSRQKQQVWQEVVNRADEWSIK